MPGTLAGRWVYDGLLWRGQGVADVIPAGTPPPPPPPAGDTTPPDILAVSVIAATSGLVQRSWPAGHQVGDLAIVVEETAAEAPLTPTGFTEGPDSPQSTGAAGTGTRLTHFYRRAASNAEAAINIGAAGGNHVCGFVVFVRGAIDTGVPYDVTQGDVAAANTTVITIPGDTTTVPNCLVLACVVNGFSGTGGQVSGWTNTSLVNPDDLTTVGPIEIADGNTGQGNGGGVAIAAGVKLTAGAYNPTTATLANTNIQGRVSLAIKPLGATAPPVVGTEMTFGPFDLITTGWSAPPDVGMSASGLLPWTKAFTGAVLYCSPSGIVRLLDNCRALGLRVHLKVTGEPHEGTPTDPRPHGGNDTYRTNYQFDFNKWADQFAAYHTAAIHAAVDRALADGTLLSFNLMDEPTHPTWGPPGWMTKAVVDEMASWAKSFFPLVPMGVVVEWQWRTFELYQVLDNIICTTWKLEDGPAASFRDDALAMGAANKVRVGVSINLEAGPDLGECVQYAPGGIRCMLTGPQLLDWGGTMVLTNGLGQKISGLYMWKARKSTWEDGRAPVAAMYTLSSTVAAQAGGLWTRMP